MRLGPINLTWWRKRPSIHVAEPQPYNNCQIIDINRLLLGRPILADLFAKRATFDELDGLEFAVVGDFVRRKRDGRTGVVIDRPLKDPENWFSTERNVVVEWDDNFHTSFDWLEDKMMPRVTAVAA